VPTATPIPPTPTPPAKNLMILTGVVKATIGKTEPVFTCFLTGDNLARALVIADTSLDLASKIRFRITEITRNVWVVEMVEWPNTPVKFSIFVFLQDRYNRYVTAIIPSEIVE